MHQRKNTEFVKNVLPVGDGGEKPVEVFLLNALGEESDDSKEVTCVGAEALECRGSEREFDGCGQTLAVVCLKNLRPLRLPLLHQSIGIPHVVRCISGKQCYGESMEIQSLEKVVDGIGPPATTVDAVEYVACGLHRQCGDLRALAVWGDCRDTGSDTDGYFFEMTQFVHHGIDLLDSRSFGVENRLGIVEDYEHLLGGKERSQGRKVLDIFDSRANDLGESGKEMRA